MGPKHEKTPTPASDVLRDAKDAPLEGPRLDPRIHSVVALALQTYSPSSELRKIVPLANTTIYEMEQRGEFPPTLFLTSRSVVWDLAEVEPNWKPTPLPETTQRPDPGRETKRSAA